MKLRCACLGDAPLLYEIRNHPDVRRWCLSPEEIAFDTHVAWLASCLQSQEFALWIASEQDADVGYVRAFYDDRHVCTLSYAVHPDHQGRGVATDMVAGALKLLQDQRVRVVHAQVKRENQWSRHLLTSLGFRQGRGELLLLRLREEEACKRQAAP